MVRISLSEQQVEALLNGEGAELVDSRGRVVARSVELEFEVEKALPEMLTTEEAKRRFDQILQEKQAACE